jgi:5-methylcytosine-specific restriction enzyme subunit McrC
MEKIFEDFVGGFLEEKIGIHVKNENRYLAKDNIFKLIPDIYIESKKMIIDTKYKILKGDDSKKGVSQSDMYQMVSYAIRYKVEEFVLLYPEFVDDEIQNKDLPEFIVEDEFANNHQINIKIHKLPIMVKDYDKDSYSDLKKKLDKQISESLEKILQLGKNDAQ